MLRSVLALGGLLGHVGADDANPTCNTHSDFTAGSYCQEYSNSCFPCNVLTSSPCDALGSDCCSAPFLAQCPTNPYGCVPKIPCTTSAEYSTAMSSLTSSCCPTPSACVGGAPTSCPTSCADNVDAVVESCTAMLTAQPQNIQDQISSFHQLCEDQREETGSASNPSAPDGTDTCAAVSDCGQGTYCDSSMSCYDCSFIDPSSCDAADSNCCSPEFLKNCPSNPFQCPSTKIPCATPTDYSKAMANLSTTCCATPGACTGGVPTTCTAECGQVLDEIAESCDAQIKLQPANIQTQITSFHEVCVASAQDRASGTDNALVTCNSYSDCGAGMYCDLQHNCYDCSYIQNDLCDAIDNDCCSPAFRTQCPAASYKCQPKVPCATAADYQKQMANITSECCATPGACSAGTPIECSANCSVVVNAMFESCLATQIKQQPQATQDTLVNFVQTCRDSDGNRDDAENNGDGGDGYGPTPVQCSAITDCQAGSYCDSEPACYDCGFISPGQCDAIDGNCCSADFLHNCPNNPYNCPPKVSCASPAEFSTLMMNMTHQCCPTPDNCVGGALSTCSPGCSYSVAQIQSSCAAQLSLQPITSAAALHAFQQVCVDQQSDQLDGGDGYGYGGDDGGDGYGYGGDDGGDDGGDGYGYGGDPNDPNGR